jgi:hypothetical protein
LILFLNGFLYGNGTGSRDTGVGATADIGYRMGFIRPYFAYDYFESSDCPTDGSATTAQCAPGVGNTGVNTANSRNARFGLDFYINKNQNHIQAEFSLNRGQSAWGAQSVTATNAGYVPYIAPGQQSATSLGRTAQKSLLIHWSAYF